MKNNRFKTLLRSDEHGASMVEYALLLSLIALGSILGLTTVGEKVGGRHGVFVEAGKKLSAGNMPAEDRNGKDGY